MKDNAPVSPEAAPLHGRFAYPRTAEVVYVLDPDQNIIEIISASMDEIVALTLADFPEADPNRQEA